MGFAARVFILLVIFFIIGASVMLFYSWYRTAGSYSAVVALSRLDDRYSVRWVWVSAQPKRIGGDYIVAIRLDVRLVVSKPFVGDLEKEKMRVVKDHVAIGCPSARLHVGVPFKVRETGGESSGEVVYNVPVEIILERHLVRLEPGRSVSVNVTVEPGCIVFMERPDLVVLLEPLHGGFVIDVKNTEVYVSG